MKILFINLFIIINFCFAEVLEKVVAIVNGETILLSDLITEKEKLKKGGVVDELLVANSEELLKNDSSLIDHLIDEKIVDHEVDKQGLSVTADKVEAEISQIAKRNGISKDQLLEAVKQQGTSSAEYQSFIKQRLERHSLVEKQITSKISINDEDILAYYAIHNPSEKTVFEYDVSQVLFKNIKSNPKEAEALSLTIIKKIKDGESFESLAQKYSDDEE